MSKQNDPVQSSVMRLFFMALLGLLFASAAHASTENYNADPGGAMAATYHGGALGPNPGTYGAFTYAYLDTARALVHDVYWWPEDGVGNTGTLATDSLGTGSGRELDISRNGGGRFTFQSLTLWNYTASTNIIFRGYRNGIQIYDSGDVWVQYILGSYTTYAPPTAWSDIDELRIVVKDNSIVFDPLIDNLIYTLGTPPTVTSNAATSVVADGATLSGTVNARGDSTTVTFHYGTTAAYGSSITAAQSPVTGFTDTAVSASLSGLSCNTTYHYRVSGTNIAGATNGSDQSFTTAACLPGAPTIGTATAGNAQASVSFSAPASSGGTAITGYTVTASPGGHTGTGAASPITVSGLTNGTAYTFTVTATNSAGTGAASAASNSVTPMGGQTITFGNPGTQNFGTTPTLTASSDSGLAVSFTSGTTGVCTITTGGALTFLATGPCTIHADQAGNGTYSAANRVSQSFTVAAVVPGAPTIGTATAGNTLASVGFSAPASSGGTAITGYTVTASPGGFTGTGAASPITVSGLTNGTAYTFTVTATNSAGTGAASAASNSVTPRTAQTIVVTNISDSGAGSLRQTIADAISGDTVTFAGGVTGTIILTAPLSITKDLTITGPGAAVLAVSGGAAVGIFQIPGANSLILQNLTLANGAAVGGAALLDSAGASTTINGCVFSGNSALSGGAILSSGTLTISDSTFSGNSASTLFGGAISASGGGTVAISNTLFSGNSAPAGGAIANGSTSMTLTNVTLSGNTANTGGGAIYASGGSTLNALNATVANNSTPGNGGGILAASGALVNLKNTLVANNTATASGPDIAGAITSQGYNLFGSTAGATIGGDTTGNLTNGAPLLGALANNGGATQTLALLAGSPAIDAGTCTGAPATDQRGTARPQNGSCDIGAYEATLSFVSVTPSSSGNGSISPSTVQSLSHGATTSFTLTPNAGYHIASVGGTCGGSLSGSTFTTAAVTADCTVVASFALNAYAVTVSAGVGGSASCTPNPVSHGGSSTCTASPGAGYSFNTWSGDCTGASCTLSNVTSTRSVSASFLADSTKTYTAPSATGTGNITARLSGGGTQCGFNVRQYIPLTGHAASPPAGSAPKGVSFPHGLFDFTTVNCTPGSTITLVVTYPQTLPAGTVYWKYGPTPSDASYHWYQLPASIAGNIATFSITDGSLGDDDLLANGTVIDQGGPGGGAAAVSIPTLSEWALLVLAGLMGLTTFVTIRRRIS